MLECCPAASCGSVQERASRSGALRGPMKQQLQRLAALRGTRIKVAASRNVAGVKGLILGPYFVLGTVRDRSDG